MKSHDLLVLIQLAQSNQDTNPTYQKLSQSLGISASQVFESVERCAEVRLLGKDRRTVDMERTIEFIHHALPYLFPLQIGGPCRGMPLASQAVDVCLPKRGTHRHSKLVWPSEDGQGTEGLRIDPLTRNTPALAASNPKLYRMLSCLEILRLPEHPFRTWAKEQIKADLLSLPESAQPDDLTLSPSSQEPESAIDLESVLDVASQYIAENGIRRATLPEISRVTGVAESELRKHFATETDLLIALNLRYMKTAGQFLGRLAVLSDHVREQDLREMLDLFLNFLERNENYFRFMLWSYLEADSRLAQFVSGPFNEFVSHMAKFISRVSGEPSERRSLFRGYAFSSIPQWYAFFLWAESRRFQDPSVLPGLRDDLKAFILDDVLHSLVSPSRS